MTTVSPSVFRVWTKRKYTKQNIDFEIIVRKIANLSIEGWDKLDYGINLREVDCKNYTEKFLTSIYYDDKGNVLEYSNDANQRIIPVVPGSIGDSLLRKVCPK